MSFMSLCLKKKYMSFMSSRLALLSLSSKLTFLSSVLAILSSEAAFCHDFAILIRIFASFCLSIR